MEAHADLYGANLKLAKKELASKYQQNILPAYERSFYQLLDQGEQNGINWQEVSIDKVAVTQTSGVAKGFVILHYQGKEFQLVVEKLLRVGDQWKVSQFVELQF